MEIGRQGREDALQGGAGGPYRQGSNWWTRQSIIRVQINQEEQLGSRTYHATQGSRMGKESLKTSGYKNLWALRQQEDLPASQESSLERPTGDENTHKPTHLGISTRMPQFSCGKWGK